jgi:hypothetical protein
MKAVQKVKDCTRGVTSEVSDHEQVIYASPKVDDEVVISYFFADHEHENVREHDRAGCSHCCPDYLKEKRGTRQAFFQSTA